MRHIITFCVAIFLLAGGLPRLTGEAAAQQHICITGSIVQIINCPARIDTVIIVQAVQTDTLNVEEWPPGDTGSLPPEEEWIDHFVVAQKPGQWFMTWNDQPFGLFTSPPIMTTIRAPDHGEFKYRHSEAS